MPSNGPTLGYYSKFKISNYVIDHSLFPFILLALLQLCVCFVLFRMLILAEGRGEEKMTPASFNTWDSEASQVLTDVTFNSDDKSRLFTAQLGVVHKGLLFAYAEEKIKY